MEERTEPGIRARDALLALLPHLLFLALVVASWRRWLVPFQDHGRELEVPWRLARGEVLYRDVGWYFGPLPAFLDALALRLAGFHADVLVALRTFAGLLGVEALRRLSLRLGAGTAGAAAVASAVVALCAFGVTGAWPFPYSAAALYGSVATWWAVEFALGSKGPRGSLVAAVLAGLAAGTKLETVVAVLAVAVALSLSRPRREAVGGTVVAASLAVLAFWLPLVLLGTATLVDHGFLVAIRSPDAWQLGQRALLFGGHRPATFLVEGTRDLFFPSLPFLGGAVLLAASRIPRRLHVPALLLLGAFSAAWPRRQALHLLVPVAILLAVSVLSRAGLDSWRHREVEPRAAAAAALSVAMLAAAARQPFFLRFEGYLAFSAPLALVLSLSFATRLRNRAGAVAFVAGVALGQGIAVAASWRRVEVAPVVTGTVRFLQPVAEARFLNEALATIAARTPEGSFVGSFPEPGFLLVASGRRNPFVDTQFYPGCQTEAGIAGMRRDLVRHAPEAIVDVDRPMPEFGTMAQGVAGLSELRRDVDDRYVQAGVLGVTGPPPALPGKHAASGRLLLPRPAATGVKNPGT